MRNRICFTALLLAFGVSVNKGSVRADAPGKDDAYFPWEVGDAWVYQTTHKTKKDVFDMTVTMKESWKDDSGKGLVMVQKDKRGQMRQYLIRSKDGVFMTKIGLSKSYTPEVFTRFGPPVPVVIYPLEPGHKTHWEGRLKVATVNRPIVFDGEVRGFEDVDVPAGHYHCIKLHFHEKRGDEEVDEDAWYAEGVGQVKYDGGQFTKELKSFKLGETAKKLTKQTSLG